MDYPVPFLRFLGRLVYTWFAMTAAFGAIVLLVGLALLLQIGWRILNLPMRVVRFARRG